MPIQQLIIFAILILTLVLFIQGKWRYDIVALLALILGTISGIIPFDRAFLGFSNPAVITVGAVLILSRGLQNSGVVDLIGERLSRLKGGIIVQLAALTTITALLSAFMNNVGALALLLPIVLGLSEKKNISPSKLLMPIAFASLLGGMTTLIGTPPNIIASSFREQVTGQQFSMFDFSPVGVSVAAAGLLFIVFIGWRLIPLRETGDTSGTLFEIENYLTEVLVTGNSRLTGKSIKDINDFSNAQTVIIGLIRGDERRMEPSIYTVLQPDDVLILSSDAENIKKLVESSGLLLVGSKDITSSDLQSDEAMIVEAVIMPDSKLIGGTARSLNLRGSYGINLLAVSRQGRVIRRRLDSIKFRIGDVLLLQSYKQTFKESLDVLGFLPLAGQKLSLNKQGKIFTALGIFIGALVISALGFLPVQIAFITAVFIMIITGVVSLSDAYESVNWPIIILLGAMIPVGEALETTGGALRIAGILLHISQNFSPGILLAFTLVSTMFLSDLVNNAAAVVLMAPIGISVAQGIGVSVDPFLIVIAIGASCAFLTPIGHQSNTLVMGPGGYKFGDYWRIGLLLEVIIALVAIPLVMYFWPF